MNAFSIRRYAAGSLAWPVLVALLTLLPGTVGAVEEKFDVLQIGAQTYRNVTVTTKAKQYIFLLHSTGMASVKVSQLPPDLLEKLGYATPPSKVPTNTATVWAKREIAKINAPQVRKLGKQLAEKWRGPASAKLSAMHLAGTTLVFALLGVALLFYLFYCYCCMLICQKTGNPPGILVWLPVLQFFPLLRAAGMSRWWCVAYCVPLLNIAAQDPLVLQDHQSARQERLDWGDAAPAGCQLGCFPLSRIFQRCACGRGGRPRAENHDTANGLNGFQPGRFP